MVFGGFGRNVFNPALVGRIFIYVSFAGPMNARWAEPVTATVGSLSFPWGVGGFSRWASDALTGATPLQGPARGTARGPPAPALGQRGRLDRRDQRGPHPPGRPVHRLEKGRQLAHRGLRARFLRRAAGRLLARRRAPRVGPPDRAAVGQRDARHVLHGNGPDLGRPDAGRPVDLRRARRRAHGAHPHLLDLARGHDVRDPARQHVRAHHGLAHPPAAAEAEGRGHCGSARRCGRPGDAARSTTPRGGPS